MHIYKLMLRILVNTALVATCKVVDVAFWFWKPDLGESPKEVSINDEWDSLDDKEFLRQFHSKPLSVLPGSNDTIVPISSNRVVKFCMDITYAHSEALAMDHVRTQTSIPVPRVRRVVDHSSWGGLIVMDYSHSSKQLHVCWPSLSIWIKIKVTLTLWYYLRQIRRFKTSHPSRPGPLGLHPCECSGLQFADSRQGPFSTNTALMQHFNELLEQIDYIASQGLGYPSNCQPLKESAFSPLVFTHNDLNMRNILLDDEGHLWLVDWGFAGLFPPWFEFVGMRLAAYKDEPFSWRRVIKFIAEPSFAMEEWFTRVGRINSLL